MRCGQEVVPTWGRPGPQRGRPRTRHSPSWSLNLPKPQHASTFGSQRRVSTATPSQKFQPPSALRLTLSGFSLMADSSWKRINQSTAHEFLKLFPSQTSTHQH